MTGQVFLGSPMAWTTSIWPFKHELGGGIVFNVAIHMIDLMLWFAGEYENVCAFGGDFLDRLNIDGYFSALIKFKSRAIAALEASWYNGGLKNTLEIDGTGGTVLIDLRKDNLLMYSSYISPYETLVSDVSSFLKSLKSVISRKFFKGYLGFQAMLMQDFIESIEHDKEPPVPVDDGVKSVSLAEEIYKQIEKSLTGKPSI